jgi:hypothetical protein
MNRRRDEPGTGQQQQSVYGAIMLVKLELGLREKRSLLIPVIKKSAEEQREKQHIP